MALERFVDPELDVSYLDPVKRGSGLLEEKTSKNSDNFVFKVAEFAFAV